MRSPINVIINATKPVGTSTGRVRLYFQQVKGILIMEICSRSNDRRQIALVICVKHEDIKEIRGLHGPATILSFETCISQ